MEKSVSEMLDQFKSFVVFAVSLKEQEEELWNRPIAEGKWSMKGVIGHIMLWDKYFYEEAIQKIASYQPLTLQHLNFDRFNADAYEYAKTQSKESLVDQLEMWRMNIIDAISGMSEAQLAKDYIDGDGNVFTIRDYLRDFVPHDLYHKDQIEEFIRSVR